MKRKNNIIITLFLIIATMLPGINMQAQNAAKPLPVRDRLMQAKHQAIKRNLNLDKETFVKFRNLYVRYEREMARIDFKNQTRLMNVNSDNLSQEEANLLITSQLKNARKIVNIREKYYKEFSTILTPNQIIKLYQTEADIRNKVMAERKRRALNK